LEQFKTLHGTQCFNNARQKWVPEALDRCKETCGTLILLAMQHIQDMWFPQHHLFTLLARFCAPFTIWSL